MTRVCLILPGEQVYLYIITISLMSFNQMEQTARLPLSPAPVCVVLPFMPDHSSPRLSV